MPALVTTDVVAVETILCAIAADVAVGSRCRCNATNPATCGEAIEVPSSMTVLVLLVEVAERMPTPGAKTSRQEPKFEKGARASLLVVAPTVIACGSRAGE